MATPPISREEREQVLLAYKQALKSGCRPFRTSGAGRSASEEAISSLQRDHGGSRSKWLHRLRTVLDGLDDDELSEIHGGLQSGAGGRILTGSVTDPELPVDHLIEHLTKRFERKKAVADKQKWRRIHVREKGPFAVAFMGDPHVDNDGCNWPLLRRDVEIIKKTPGMFAANAGDTLDNWTGRLARLKGHNPVTDTEAYRLAEWLVNQLRDDWILFVLGNHDTWGEGGRIFEGICKDVIRADDWQAQVILTAPNGSEFPVWLAHSFKGSSIYNPLHGPMRAHKFSGKACLYVQGHHHEFAMHCEEDADKGMVFWAAKARGYKFMDHYATVNGFAEGECGATIAAVFDPDATSPTAAIHCFGDLPTAADYLTWLRERRAAA